MAEMHYCEKCSKSMDVKNFYLSWNLDKYPTGVMKQCKGCMTMHINNWDPDTFLWILQEADVPWVPTEWQKCMDNYVKNGKTPSNSAVMGRYLAKMKLKQWKDFRWKDNEYLRERQNNLIRATMEQEGYDAVEIQKAIDKQDYEPITEAPEMPDLPTVGLRSQVASPQPVSEDSWQQPSIFTEETAEDLGLTEEDIIYLRLKWGKTYRPEEWVKLEQLYEEMMGSYDIQAAGDINTLKLACKSSLKANQLLDLGDIDGAQKAMKMYDALMKSGKWTAAQNKGDTDEVVDSIGELVAICEKDGFIPKFYTSGPQDHIDRVLEDMQRYTRELIDNEAGLSQMMENAVKQMTEEAERIKEAGEKTDEDAENDLFDYDKPAITTEDFSEFDDFEDALEEADKEFYKSLLDDDEEDL